MSELKPLVRPRSIIAAPDFGTACLRTSVLQRLSMLLKGSSRPTFLTWLIVKFHLLISPVFSSWGSSTSEAPPAWFLRSLPLGLPVFWGWAGPLMFAVWVLVGLGPGGSCGGDRCDCGWGCSRRGLIPKITLSSPGSLVPRWMFESLFWGERGWEWGELCVLSVCVCVCV